jgi:myo-inositol-1(or 4)-monophosphatase
MNILEFTTKLARNAGDLLLQYYHPAGIQSELKADHTVVTDADLAADEFLRAQITQAFPEDGILSEEAETTYPIDISRVWVIDPLDGTTNFSLGLHYWGVSIARLKNGIPEVGVLYFPMINELFTAEQGHGAYLNGSQLQVVLPDPLEKRSFFSCCSRTHRSYKIEIPYKTRILGSAAYGLVAVARGSAAFALEITPKVWDFSASWLIMQEAGGFIAPLDGPTPFPLIPDTEYGNRSFALLTATTPTTWQYARDRITRE